MLARKNVGVFRSAMSAEYGFFATFCYPLSSTTTIRAMEPQATVAACHFDSLQAANLSRDYRRSSRDQTFAVLTTSRHQESTTEHSGKHMFRPIYFNTAAYWLRNCKL